MKLAVAAFEPDKAPMEGGTSLASGVLPVSPASYGPAPAPAPYGTNALVQPTGLWAFEFYPGMGNLFSMDCLNQITPIVSLYRIQAQKIAAGSTSGAWSAFPIAGATHGAGALNTPLGRQENMTSFKSLVLMSAIYMPVQQMTISAAGIVTGVTTLVNSSAYPNAPYGQYIATVRDFLFLGNTYDPVGGWGPSRVWWSALNDPTAWPTPGSAAAQQVQSDYNDFPAPLGQVTGLAGNLANCDVAVFFEHGIMRGTYVGPPAVFDFTLVQGAQGTISPSSIVAVGGLVYYVSDKGFFAFDGTVPEPVGRNRVDAYFLGSCLDRTRVASCYRPETNIVRWAYPVGPLDTRVLHYGISADRWTVLDWPYSPVSMCNSVIPMSGSVTGAPPQTQTFMLGNTSLGPPGTGGVANLYAINGAAMQAQVGTNEVQPVPGRKTFIRGVRPLADGAGSTVTAITRDNETDPLFWNPPVAQDASGLAPMRAEGRYAQFTVSFPPGAAWTHIEGVDVDGVPSGAR